MYTTEKGGIIPREAAEHHKRHGEEIIKKALGTHKIDIVAFSQGPGLAPSLLVGMELAKKYSKKLNVPLIGVNHLAAHLEIGKLLTKTKDPIYVFVSGANTQIISREKNRYRILGETLSIGLGNALDKFGREANLGFPAGPKIEELAKKGSYVELPYVVKGMDMDFSGIITKAVQLLKNHKLEDICFSLQETCFAMITEVTERALAFSEKDEAILIGGVAANKRFNEMLNIMCKERGAKYYITPINYTGDQAVMIAFQGILEKDKREEDIDIKPRWRLDEIEITY